MFSMTHRSLKTK